MDNNQDKDSFGFSRRPEDESEVNRRSDDHYDNDREHHLTEQNSHREGDQSAGEPQSEPHYYSYGPFKSGMNREEAASDTTVTDSSGPARVEVTPPKPLRSFSFGQQAGSMPPDEPAGGWQFNKPRKTSRFKSTFAAFLAGAVVVGALMFAADRANLFTGSQGVMTNNPSSGGAAAAANNGSGGGVVPSNLDLARPNNIAEIFQQASPAVVKIETKVKSQSSGRSGSMFDDPFFRYFFGDQYNRQPNNSQPELQPGGMGTGFIFEKSGYILTNEHVVDGADEIYVTVQGYDEPFKAELLGNSYDLDLAALKIKGDQDFPTIPIGSSDELQVGDWVVAIGNPYGFDHTVTVGVLSAKERPISIPDQNGTREYKHLLQTDASINPGNSGGPLLNLKGEVIGINTAVSAQAQGIGFAIPETTFNAVLENLKNNVEIPKEPIPYIGVQLDNINKDWLNDLKLDSTEGTIIVDVERRSPAFQAGLRPYDVVLDINGQKVKNASELSEAVKKLKVGDTAKLGVMRDGKKMEFDVTIGDRNANQE